MIQTVSLSDICTKITSGGTPLTKRDDYYGGGIPWLRTQEVNFGNIYSTEKTITELGLNNSSAKIIPKDSVIVAMYGATAGKSAINKIPLTTNQACCNLIIDNNKADYRFVYYYLVNSYEKLLSAAVGAAQQNLGSKQISAMTINLPPLYQQKKIADILSSLDEKIELNRRMNKTLEQLGQALFRHYFVDNPEAKNWDEGTLGDIMNITMGQSPPGKSYNNNGDGVVFYQGRADFGLRYPNIRLFTTDPKRFAKVGDVLLTVRAPVGDVNQASERCCIGRGLAAISSRTGAVSFCYYYCHQLKADFLEYNSEGTVFGSINSKQLKALKLKIPPIGLVEKFENEVAVIDKTIMLNSYQVKTLVVLRDSLLPKLISGEIEV
jgi:type I restriction-modification system specificity subunit